MNILQSFGEIAYITATIVEVSSKNIAGDTILLSLGSDCLPGTDWHTPDVQTGGGNGTMTVKLLIGGTYQPPPGNYYLWCKITDFPEVAPRPALNICYTII